MSEPDSMLAVRKTAPGRGVVVERVPVRPPAAGEARVRVTAASICGTDLHIYDWDSWAASAVRTPVVIGHEVTGIVEETNGDTGAVRTGDAVSLESHIYCGDCALCRSGRCDICPHQRILGVDIDGGYAQYVTVPARILWRHRRPVPPEVGTIYEPLGNAVHCATEARVEGKRVAVFGCGPAGLFAVAACRALGAAEVVAVEPDGGRRALAGRMGAHRGEADGASLEGAGFDAALEMSGAPAAVRQALRALRNGGVMVAFGIPARPVEVDLARDVILRGIHIAGVVGRRIWSTWELVDELVGSGRLDPRPAITHRFPMAQFDRAVETIRARRETVGKVVLFP
jgi:threonine 3-dehydrogenase